MSTPENILKEINKLTGKLVELGLSDNQNFPILKTHNNNIKEITFAEKSSLSYVLKDSTYDEIYYEIKQNRDYNIYLADGGILQIEYEFKDDEIQKHRLAFFPCPDLTLYQNDPELYETDLIYVEILHKNIVSTPLRLDFDRKSYQEDLHPMSHLTIGQYKNCRIPVASAVSPHKFFEFILGSFYNTAFRNFREEIGTSQTKFSRSIAKTEEQRIHISLECDLPT